MSLKTKMKLQEDPNIKEDLQTTQMSLKLTSQGLKESLT